MPFCCASTAALMALSRPARAGKPRREASIKELEDALACAKAGELQIAQLEAALAAATRRSEVVARRVVGLEAEFEGASRLLNALEEDEACQEEEGPEIDVQGGSATLSFWQAPTAVEGKRFSPWSFACFSRSDDYDDGASF